MGYNYVNQGVVWKNGEVYQTITESNSVLNSICMSGSDIYVCGQIVDAEYNSFAKIWKNGQLLHSLDGPNAYSIVVSGSDVYAAGDANFNVGDYDIQRAAFWKNGVAQTIELSEPDKYSRAHAVCVSGSDVYVTGYESDENWNNVIALWKNGVHQTITPTEVDSEARSVAVSGGNVYVVGKERNSSWINFATLWINGEAQKLRETESIATAIFIY
jgi:hypothetical protein